MTRNMDLDPSLHSFQFTRNWFRNRNLSTFREYVYPQWAGKTLTYLELGVFEGMSMVWMLQHVLTQPGSRSVGIDPWLMTTKLDGEEMERVYQRALHNTSVYPNCQLIRGCSAEVIRRMCGRGGYAGISKGSLDLCMIDGNHNALYVVDDAKYCFQLLKPGGVMLFDDVENQTEKRDHVKQALPMFLEQVGTGIEFLWKHKYMEAYRKI